MSECYERLCASLYSLVGRGTLQERLRDAYNENLRYLKPEDVPPKYRSLLSRLHVQLNSQLDDDQAHELIDQVLEFAMELLGAREYCA